jgi:predicted Zn-ribbon and HTH transcriptional regulator
MPIDPRELRPAKAGLGEVVLTDRPCKRCGYSLRGLPTNGTCPECGLPIGGGGNRFKRINNNLANAPLGYLNSLHWGLVLMACFSVSSVAAFFLFSGGSPVARALFVGISAVGWWVGVYLVTAPRPIDENTPHDWLLDNAPMRTINRTVQAAWALAAVALFASAQAPAPVSLVAAWLALFFLVIGLLGLIPVSIQLSALADWAQHTDLAGRFRIAVWMIAACGLLLVLTFPTIGIRPLAGFWLMALSASTICIVLAQILFLICLFQLAITVRWAINNAQFASDRLQRLAERTARGGELPRPCSICDYDLRGLPITARCPECGHLDDSLRFSGIAALHGQARPERPEDTAEVPLEPPTERSRPSKVKLRELSIGPRKPPSSPEPPPQSPNIGL